MKKVDISRGNALGRPKSSGHDLNKFKTSFRFSLGLSVPKKRRLLFFIVRFTVYLAQCEGFLCYSSDKESKSHGIFHAQLLVNVSRCLHTTQKVFIKRTVSRDLEMVNVYLALPESAAGSL